MENDCEEGDYITEYDFTRKHGSYVDTEELPVKTEVNQIALFENWNITNLGLDLQPGQDYPAAADPNLGLDRQPGPDYLAAADPNLDLNGHVVADPNVTLIFMPAQDCHAEAATSMGFWVQKCPKDRAVPYLVSKDGSLTTKNMVPVAFCASGVKSSHRIIVTMRYSENPNQNKPVNSCKLHECKVCSENQREHPTNFNFCIVQKESWAMQKLTCEYVQVDGHPTAFLTNFDTCRDPQGNVTFQVIISCLNSCNPHRDSGKKMELNLQMMEGTTVLFEKHINVRACKNVKRDHKDEEPQTTDARVKNEPRHKKLKTENLLDETSPAVKNACSEPHYFFQMNTPKQTQLIVDLIKEMGGTQFNMDDLP